VIPLVLQFKFGSQHILPEIKGFGLHGHGGTS